MQEFLQAQQEQEQTRALTCIYICYWKCISEWGRRWGSSAISTQHTACVSSYIFFYMFNKNTRKSSVLTVAEAVSSVFMNIVDDTKRTEGRIIRIDSFEIVSGLRIWAAWVV